MKLILLAALILMGCGSKEEPKSSTGAPLARPSVTDPVGFCERAQMVMMARKKCFPEDTSIQMGLDAIVDLVKDAPADPAKRRRIGATCATTLQGVMNAEQPKNCPLDVTDAERAELTAFLDAWYGERTPPPTTGDAAIDAVLVRLAGQRDLACACKDLACAHAAGDTLEAMPSAAPPPAVDAAAKMADEVARCRQKLAFAPAR